MLSQPSFSCGNEKFSCTGFFFFMKPPNYFRNIPHDLRVCVWVCVVEKVFDIIYNRDSCRKYSSAASSFVESCSERLSISRVHDIVCPGNGKSILLEECEYGTSLPAEIPT